MRCDCHVENEATIFLLYSIGGGVPDREALLSNLRSAVANGWAVPVELIQDDSFNVRIVIGDLNEQEQADWVGMVEWNLQVPGDRLAIDTRWGGDMPAAEAGILELEIPADRTA